MISKALDPVVSNAESSRQSLASMASFAVVQATVGGSGGTVADDSMGGILSVHVTVTLSFGSGERRTVLITGDGQASLHPQILNSVQRPFELPPSGCRQRFILPLRVPDALANELQLGQKFVPLFLEGSEQGQDLI